MASLAHEGGARCRRRGSLGGGFLDVSQSFGRAAVDDTPSAFTCGGPDVHKPIRTPHHVDGVLDDEEAVTALLEPLEDVQQRTDILRMEPGGRFVQHVDDAEKFGSQLGCQTQTLKFSA